VLRNLLSRATPSLYTAKRPAKPSIDDSLALKIDADSSLNWDWGRAHFVKVVNKCETFDRVIQRIKMHPLSLVFFVAKAPLSNSTEEPINVSRYFCKTGNNFFLFPFLFVHRYLVAPHHSANLYIRTKRGPEPYSKWYFDTPPAMCDAETAAFLREDPFEINPGSLSSGRHRAIATTGTSHRGEPYPPLFAVKAS
jgi:hypothetical protein